MILLSKQKKHQSEQKDCVSMCVPSKNIQKKINHELMR